MWFRSGHSGRQQFGSRSHFASRTRSRVCFLAMAFCFPTRPRLGWVALRFPSQAARIAQAAAAQRLAHGSSRAAASRRSTQPRNPRGPRAAGSLREEASALCRWRGCPGEGDAPRVRKFSKAPCRLRHFAPENLRAVIRACPSFQLCR